MVHQATAQFLQLFGKRPLIVYSPGRINLIGEHTDYNDGFVLPAAIDKQIIYAIELNGSNRCQAYSTFNSEMAAFDLDNVQPTKGWINYLMGVVYQLQQRGLPVKGFDCVIAGDIPIGAGMSSSAAVEGGLAAALNHLMGYRLSTMELALIGQKAEHTFPGVQCGIMDQFANLHGKKDQVMLLDCRDLSYTYYPFNFPDQKIVLCNSMVHHSLASSEYNVRRQQCEEGVKALQTRNLEVRSLRDASAAMLETVKEALSADVYKRCSYVIAEIARVQEACTHLQQGSLQAFGRLMYETHEGLSKLYEVSCPELDFLVELAQQRPEVAGARMMGGGFGGCTINLVRTDHVEDYTTFIQSRYKEKFGKTPEVYVTTIEDGVSLSQG
jgi:galactokinase